MKPRQFLIVAALAAVLLLLWWLGLFDLLSFDVLQARQAEFQALWADDPWRVLALFFLLYVAVTALSIPGAAILTLGAGALFGLVTGTILASFASTIGATLAFLGSRYLLRDWVKARFGGRLSAIDAGIASDGAFYLFSLRLIPVVPFFITNLLMGLTTIPARTFALVSQIGMLAGTIVYVNAGTQLAGLDSPAGILSPALVGSFVALGLFPWVARAMLARLRERRVYARWKRPRRFDRNLVVIGGGAAGLVTAYIAATVRAKVTLVEAAAMGGDCLNTGCVPSKALIASARRAADIRDSAAMGIASPPPVIDFPAVIGRATDVIDTIAPHDSVERYRTLGVDARIGHARLIDPWTVEITGPARAPERLTTRSIVLATGARPVVPPIPGIETTGYLTSETLWGAMRARATVPPRLVVLGGGPIGCELAQSFQRLGSAVTLVEMADRLLSREDADAADLVARAMANDGVRLLTAHKAVRADGRTLRVEGAGAAETLVFDDLLIAIGRTARTDGFGLDALGIPAGRTIETNAWLETLYPNIYAVGDAAGPFQLTHAASHTAWHGAVNALFGRFRRFRVDYRFMPAATYTQPEVASIGLNETRAADEGIAVDVTRFPLSRSDRALADGDTTGFVKYLTAPGKDRILGCTIVGAHAGDMLAEVAMAMKHGIGLTRLMGVIHPYPTLAEANKLAAGEWRRANAPEWALGIAERYHRWQRG